MPHLCFVAGDPSGDAHAARLFQALKAIEPSLCASALGGPHLAEAGAELIDELTRAAAIGPFDAARHLGRFLQARKRLERHLRERRPDAVVLVDFGDFNLPVVAPLAKRAGCRVLYFISPQIWAWGRGRLRWAQRYVDRMLVLFRFEEAFYREAGVPVTWVGHPLVDAAVAPTPADQARHELGLNPARVTVGLLPGSRAQEISRHLPILLAAARRITRHMPGAQFLLPRAPQAPERAFRRLASAAPGLSLIVCPNRVYDCWSLMDAAIVASGTATLEGALFGVPMAVVYRTSLPTYLAARAVVRVPHVAMVNLIAGRELAPEFIQQRAHPRMIADAVVALLRDANRRDSVKAGLAQVRERLGPPGAIGRAAGAILAELGRRPEISRQGPLGDQQQAPESDRGG